MYVNGCVWKSVTIAIVCEPIRCYVSDVEMITDFKCVGEFEVRFGLVGEVPDHVRQLLGRYRGGARVYSCGIW